jgi:cytochrome c
MKAMLLAVAAAGTLLAGAVQAQDMLKAKGCLGCHEMDKKKVGPAYKDVAAKYQGNKDAESILVAKLKEGKGHLKISATDDELKACIKQVLATK